VALVLKDHTKGLVSLCGTRRGRSASPNGLPSCKVGPRGAKMTRTIRTIGPAVAAALALGACSNFNFGGEKEKPAEENLYPKNYKAAILDRLRAQLPDPKSIRGAFLAEPVLKPRDAITRYIACIRLDAKDDRGQYRGNKEYAAFFYGGELTQIVDATRELCDKAAYQPFPELERL
jgi:hypothetical protein